MIRYRTESETETFELGRRLGARAHPGTVVAVRGALGAGKTVLAKGIGAGLEVPGRVQSPTYVIVQSHEDGRLPLFHADLYRLVSEEDLEQLGLYELLEGAGVCVIEWAERLGADLPSDRLDVTLVIDGDAREVAVVATGPRHAHLERLGG